MSLQGTGKSAHGHAQAEALQRAAWARWDRQQLLPSSSSSAVMDLERKVRAVVGARFGGGGALWVDRGMGVRTTIRPHVACTTNPRPPILLDMGRSWEAAALEPLGQAGWQACKCHSVACR